MALVIVGHWFYELCVKFIHIRLHENDNGQSITVDEIVGEWNDIIREIGDADDIMILEKQSVKMTQHI